MINILFLLPKNLLSRFVGFLMQISFGTWVIKIFADIYRINISEAEKPLEQYKSIGDFFTRRLKPLSRLLGDSAALHPADSRISQIGIIEKGQLIQAKGKFYSVINLLTDNEALVKFDQGLFATYYLCPTDYHRVHSPVNGQITSVKYIPGQLWPVNDWSTHRIEELFCRNERVVVEISTIWGLVALVFVGATNVGKISLSFEQKIVSNQGSSEIEHVKYNQPLAISKGQELGIFHMGSTVIMCYPEKFCKLKALDFWQQYLSQKVKMGENFL
jgi:phosphatidylserine decarboxylase